MMELGRDLMMQPCWEILFMVPRWWFPAAEYSWIQLRIFRWCFSTMCILCMKGCQIQILTLFWVYILSSCSSITSSPSAFVLPWPDPLFPLQESIHWQSNIGPLCVNIYMEMIDSALCKWTLYRFCQMMGLELSQKWSTPLMSTLFSSSNHEMLHSA